MSRMEMGIMIISSHENHGPVLAGISDSGTMRVMKGSTIEQARNTITESFTLLRGCLSDCIEFILNHLSRFGIILSAFPLIRVNHH